MNKKMVILGTGQLGLAIMDELVGAGGYDITLVNRSGRVRETLPTGVSLVSADVTNPADVRRVTAGAEAVFLCAQPPYHEWPEKFPPIINGVLEGLKNQNIPLVFGDNLYMYGSTAGAPIHEKLPYAASGRKGRTRALLANTLLEAHHSGRVPVVIGRASDFYGPRVTDSALGRRVFEAALAGQTADLLGDIDQPHTYTYIRDFARGLVTLSQHPDAFGDVWHIPNAPTGTTRDLLQTLEQIVGRPIKIRTAGRLMVWIIGLFNKTMREFNEMFYEFSEPYVVDHTKFAAAFGANPTPHAEALRETVAWYQTQL